jgi:tagaturonate reductase
MPSLNQHTLPPASGIPASVFDLPEKVLQFGTGVLLRGLHGYLIDQANRQGLFNGRIVAVKSTDAGDPSDFEKQDNLYTICVRGLEEGQLIEKDVICAAISRVLSAKSQWRAVLDCAANPELRIIISNTTETGIQLVRENIHQDPPQSFPGKLLSFLYERYRVHGGSADSGMLIIPSELLTDNGLKLKAIVYELAEINQLGADFMSWLREHNTFCNSLVDRIVPGAPDAVLRQELAQKLGYEDRLLILTESYLLWAIEGDEKVRSLLTFQQADEGVVIAESIDEARELKLRLLNGTHTLSCGLAFLAGFQTVREAMENPAASAFISRLMLSELAPAIPIPLDAQLAQRFGQRTLDRFRNPHLAHQWLSITLQYTSKMKMRNVPTLLSHYQKSGQVPPSFALGFAGYLLFMKAVKEEGNQYYGEYAGQNYLIRDDQAGYFYKQWQTLPVEGLVSEVLADQALWETDLTQLPGFVQAVTRYLQQMLAKDVRTVLEEFTQKLTQLEA